MTKHFDHINDSRQFVVDKLSDDALLGRKGNVMRQSLYIWQYEPSQEQYAKELVAAICEGDLPARGVSPLVVNLYDIVLEELDSQGLWEPLMEAESSPDNDRRDIILMLQDVVSVGGVISPKVNEIIADHPEANLVFINGVGETYPYVRTHAILTELTTSKPVVLMFPGRYEQRSDGSSSLDILNIEQGSNGGYYRATNVYDL